MIELEKFKYYDNPFPYYICTDTLPLEYITELQNEILNMDMSLFDRMDNWFEQKFVLRNKNNIPVKCMEFFNYLNTEQFVDKLSKLVDIPLIVDTDKNFWGIHKFKSGDKLDIHLDAGIYHKNLKKKYLTLGFYLSYEWDSNLNGGFLELWDGDSCIVNNYKLHKCTKKIAPDFNTMVLFINTDNAWHGSPEPVKCIGKSERIFITCSYLANLEDIKITNMTNTLQKALFIQHPDEEYNEEKQKAIMLRANPETCHMIYQKDKYNLVLISSAIITINEPLSYTPVRSYFTHQQRYEQTLNTIESIKNKIPYAYIVLVEGTELPEMMYKNLVSKVDYIHKAYLISDIYKHVNSPYKGLGEGSSLLSYLQSQHYKEHEILFNSISKISGRYKIRNDFEWLAIDDKIVCNIKCNTPDHPSGIYMSTMFYTVGNKIKDIFIEALSLCCNHNELHNGIALEHVLPLCMIYKKIIFYGKQLLRVEGEYGPWGGYVCH